MRKLYVLLFTILFAAVANSQTIPVFETSSANNTAATAMLVTGPAKIRGNLFPNGDVDYYQFTALAGDRVYVAAMTSFSSGSSTDCQLTLYASDGTTVIEFDDDNGSFAGFSSSIAGATIPANGTYYIRVNDFTAGTTSERGYDLYLKLQSGSPTAEVESNDTPGTANPLPGSGWVSGARNPAAATEQDWFSVTLTAGQSIFISMDLDPERDGITYNGRLGFALFGDAGNQILVVDDAGSSEAPNPTIPSEAFLFTAKDAGTYYVFADASSAAVGGPTATYNISVSIFAATPGYVNYPSADIPKIIGPGAGLVTSTLTIADSKLIKDLAVRINLNHALMADIDATLTSPNGNVIALFTDIGAAATGGQTQMDLLFDDNNGIPPAYTVMRPMGYQPELASKMDQFKNMNTAGVWTLTLYDDGANVSGGTLTSWSLEVLEEVPPILTGTTIIANEDFELSDGGFTHSGAQDEWERGTPSFAPITTTNSGTNCWKTDLDNTYNASGNQLLESSTYNLSGLIGPIWLSWAMKYQIESASFDQLQIYVEEVGNPANTKILFEWLGATQTATVGNPAVTVNLSAGWGTYYADISSFAGLQIRFKVRLVTDGTVQLCGIAIDDFKINSPCIAPAITTDPVSVSLCAGSTANFSVVATGTPALTYQWQEDAGGGFLDIAGATSSTLSFITLASQNGYLYRCVVTNACNIATSNFATLTVSANPVATIAYGQTLYASDSASNLYQVNIATGAFTFVGNFDGAAIGSTDIEYEYSTGRAFAQGRDGTFGVYEFNINTGAYIGPVFPDGGSHTGLEYVGPTLYATVIFGPNGPSELHTLDPLTGVSTNIGATGTGPISGLAYNMTSGVMYGINGGPGIANLYTINLATGAATMIGATGIQAGSLQYGSDGRLYAGGSGPNRGNMYVINTTTGIATLLGATGVGSGVTGLTLANIPAVFCTTQGTVSVIRNGSPGGTYTSSPAGLSLNASTGDITTGTSASGNYTVTYTIPPVGVCAAFITSAPVTINPVTSVNPVGNQTVCNGSPTAAVTFSGGLPGTVYNWTNNNASIGLAASGSGNIASFIATNAGASPVTSTIVVTPSYTSSGVTCNGPTTTFFITVNPSPTVTISGGNVTVCPGITVNLTTTATAGVTYSWVRSLIPGGPSTPAGTTPGISVTQSGIYTVTVLAGTGCTGTASTAVTVADYSFTGSITNADASQNDRLVRDGIASTCASPKVCPGGLTGAAYYYDTYTITNPQSIAVCATIGLASTCGLNVFSAAYLGSYNPASLCTNYLGDAGVSATSSFYEVTIPANGTIVVVVNDVIGGGPGCASYTLSVHVPRAAAAITTTPSTTVCLGVPVTLTASPANTYLWSPGGATTQSIIVSPAVNTTYSVTLGYGNRGCTASASQLITVNPPPTLTAPVNRTICSGQNTTFSVTASGAGPFTYQWQIDQGSGFVNLANVAPFSNVTTATLNITAASVVYSGNIFRCLVTGACGTTTSASATLTVNPIPNITVAPSGVCAPVVLTAQGNSNTYSWSPATGLSSTTGAVVTANPTATTTYTVTGTITATGCQNSATATVLGTPPAPVITPSTATICAGSVQSLTASSSTTFAGGSILIPAVGTSGPASPYPAVITVSGLPTTGVTVRSVTINGVVHTFPGDVDILLQSPTTTNVVLMSDVGGGVDNTGQNYTFDDAGALMSFVALNPSGTYRPSNNGATDTWIAPGPGAITQATPAISSFTGNPNGNWSLFIVDDAGGDVGSISSWSITFNVNTAVWSPVTGLFTDPGATIPYVAGTALNTVYFTQSPLVTTVYTVTATNVLGTCSSGSASATITVNPRPTIAVGPNNQCGPVVLTATGNSNTYSWSPAAGLSATTGASVTANPTVATLYTVTGTLTATGCTNSATVNVFATPPAPVISPANVNICAGAITQLTATATPAAVWTPVTGLFTDVVATIPYVAGTPLNTVYAKPAVTTTYSVTSTLGSCTSVATNVTVTVTTPITITTQPASQTVCQGTNVTFSVVHTGNLQSYQWQVSTNGGATFTNIAGANNSTLVLPAVATTLSGNQYRVLIANSCSAATSSAATLTVNPLPVVTASGFPARICITDTLVPLVGSPVGGSWTGIGVSGFNFVPPATAVGTYTLTYTYTTALGCTATATIITKVEDCQERLRLLSANALILFPNPNIGRFNIRINSTLYNYLGMRVYTSTGHLVRTQIFSGLVYGRVIPIDMTNLPAGVYMVKFYYDDGNRTSEKAFKVVVGSH